MKKNRKMWIMTAVVIVVVAMLVVTTVINCTALINSSNNHISSATISAVSYYSHQINAALELEKQKVHDLGEAIRYEKYDTENRDGLYDFLIDSTSYLTEMFAVYVGCPDNFSCFSDGWIPDSDYVIEEREWYKLAVTSDKPVITEPYIDALTGKMVVTIAYAVHDDAGKLTSVIAADMFITDIQNIVSAFSYMDSGYPILVTGSGTIIIHRNEDFMPKINDQKEEMHTDFNTTYTDITQFKSAGRCKSCEFTDYDGISKFVVLSEITASGWTLYYVMDKSEIYSDVTYVVWVFIVMIPFVIVIFIIFSILIIKWKQVLVRLKEEAERADAASRAKNNFLANMSHEIRTPMNAVVGMTELILRENDISDTVRDYCYHIKNSGKNLLSIINDILDFSKIESGKMELIEDDYNIASTLNDICNMALVRIDEKPLEYIAYIDPEIPVGLVGDELRQRQVIINLVTNAIKYSNEGCVVMKVYLNRDKDGIPIKPHENEIELVVEVIDTGIGIAKEDMGKLFDSFQQVDTKKNRSVEGTGLGLPISKLLIELMGGGLSVESTYGKGSNFNFKIPVRYTDETPFLMVKDAENVHAAIYVNLKKYLHEDTRNYLQQNYEKMGNALGIDVECFYQIDELQRRMKEKTFTHILTNARDYWADEAFFKDIPELIIMQKHDDILAGISEVKHVYEPLSTLSLTAVLNGESLINSMNDNQPAAKFTAPDARVLIVDDNHVNLQVASGLIKPYQIQLETATSGPEAITLLQENKNYDIVFMDYMMPGMDGVEAAKIIRKLPDEYFKNVPIIALTANAIIGAKDMFINAGMNGFLAKPIEMVSLNNVLKSFLPKQYIQKNAAPDAADVPISVQVPEGDDEFNPKTGVFYSGGHVSVYHNVLKIFLISGEKKQKIIRALYENKDWENYIIEVHALKSASLTIGSKNLSELAHELEHAGKKGNIDKIEAKTEELLSLYQKVLAAAGKYYQENVDDLETPVLDDNLTEASQEVLQEWIQKIIDGCSDMNVEEVESACNEAFGYSYNGKPLKPQFDEILSSAQDFEFDEAADKAKMLLG